jgi:carbamoyltransferase
MRLQRGPRWQLARAFPPSFTPMGRLQIVRERTDPLTYAYLKALGRRIGVEAAVNTSFNVAGPIAQSATQAINMLRRSKGMDAVLMFAEEGSVFAAWHADAMEAGASGAHST